MTLYSKHIWIFILFVSTLTSLLFAQTTTNDNLDSLNFNSKNDTNSEFNTTNYFMAVEEMPQPIGGLKSIQEKVIYTIEDKRQGIHGKVEIKAYIDTSGYVRKAEIIKGIGGSCDESALNAVKNTKFVAGKQRGKKVKVQPTISIRFKLDNGYKSLPPKKVDKSKYIFTAENMPEAIGGIDGIQRSIKYPEEAKKLGVQGRVFVKAFVNEVGIVKKAEIIKGIGAGCDEAAIDAVLKTEFKPGIQDGRPIKVQVSIPLLFRLN